MDNTHSQFPLDLFTVSKRTHLNTLYAQILLLTTFNLKLQHRCFLAQSVQWIRLPT